MTATAGPWLGPIATAPGEPPEDEWVEVARDLAERLAADAAERERAAATPVAEVALFREAGLLALIASPEIGGVGRPYAVAMAVVRQIAQVDSGLARVLAYHYAFSNRQASDLLSAERYRDFERRAVANRWQVASTGSPLGEELAMTGSAARGYRLDGTKYFATGARVADRIIGFVTDPERDERLLVEINPGREEVEFLDDWDIIGERLSASNGLILTDYALSADEIIGSLGRDDAPRDRIVRSASCRFSSCSSTSCSVPRRARCWRHASTRGRRPGPGSTRGWTPRPKIRTSSPPTGIW